MVKKLFHSLDREESGSILVMVACFMTAALLLCALCLDLGCLYVRSGQVQTAADAAALAAGRLLPISAKDEAAKRRVTDTAAQYLAKNGGPAAGDCEFYFGEAVDGKLTTFGVKASGTVKTTFAGIIGVHTLPFTKVSEVQTMVCVRLNDVVPLSVQQSKLSACLAAGTREHITLKYGAKGDSDLPSGSFGAIDLDGVKGGGANDYENWLLYGYSGQLSVGSDLYPVESGNMAGPTGRAFAERYDQCTHFPGQGGCTADHYVAYCPRVIKVPVVEYDEKKYVRIVGFAAFVLEGQPEGMKDTIVGSYVDMVTIGSAGGDATGSAEDFGVYSLMLSK